jgi:hypothetical protein
LNYFVQLILPHDELISGLAFGFVTVYATNFDDRRGHFYTERKDASEFITNNFYCLNTIQSTNIGLSVLDRYNKPMNVHNDFNSKNARIEKFDSSSRPYNYIVSNELIFEKIFFLELQPFRESIMYSSIEYNDEDRKLECFRIRIDYKCSIIIVYE